MPVCTRGRPVCNTASHCDGQFSQAEYHWRMRMPLYAELERACKGCRRMDAASPLDEASQRTPIMTGLLSAHACQVPEAF